MPHPTSDAGEVPRDAAALFGLLDELAQGLAREAALAPAVPRNIHLADSAADSPDPEPHPCPDCFTQRYRAWQRARGAVGATAAG